MTDEMLKYKDFCFTAPKVWLKSRTFAPLFGLTAG